MIPWNWRVSLAPKQMWLKKQINNPQSGHIRTHQGFKKNQMMSTENGSFQNHPRYESYFAI